MKKTLKIQPKKKNFIFLTVTEKIIKYYFPLYPAIIFLSISFPVFENSPFNNLIVCFWSEGVVKKWKGPLSLSLYLTDYEAVKFLEFHQENSQL